MATEGTPKRSGPHRRWGRPFGVSHPLHITVVLVLVIIVFVVLIGVVSLMMKRTAFSAA